MGVLKAVNGGGGGGGCSVMLHVKKSSHFIFTRKAEIIQFNKN